MHDLFANDDFRQQWLIALGWTGSVAVGAEMREQEYERLADVVKRAVDWPEIKRIIGLDVVELGEASGAE